MNITVKDIKSFWRSPFIWLVLAVVSFMMAWIFWQMIDRYNTLQVSFTALPNPPNITASLWVPFAFTLAKMMMVLLALTAGFSFAQERSQRTLWYLMINQSNYLHVVFAKFRAQLVMLLFMALQITLVTLLLSTGGELNWPQVVMGSLGLMLFSVWLMSLGQLLSSYCQSTGAAVLLNVVIFVLLWMLGGDVVSKEYGLNWLHLLSPVIHLKWFCEAEINLSSLVYFILGSGLFMLLTAQQIKNLRAKL